MKYIILAIAVLINTTAFIIFKKLAGQVSQTRWVFLFLLTILFAVINNLLFTKSLKELGLGVVYPLFSAASITLITIVSAMFFGEKFSTVNIVGFFVIVAGIVMVTR